MRSGGSNEDLLAGDDESGPMAVLYAADHLRRVRARQQQVLARSAGSINRQSTRSPSRTPSARAHAESWHGRRLNGTSKSVDDVLSVAASLEPPSWGMPTLHHQLPPRREHVPVRVDRLSVHTGLPIRLPEIHKAKPRLKPEYA